jgi:CBS domain containing-hemolysin-like protein
MDSAGALGIISLLILVNGFFVAAEFALVGAPRAVIERKASEGHRAARLLQRILREPRLQDRYFATAQIGITLASLGLGMYGEHTVARWIYRTLQSLDVPSWIAAHGGASVLAVGILTCFHIVLGELVPKSLALQYADRSALWVAGPMSCAKMAFYPLVVAFTAMGNAILRLIHVERQLSSGHFVTPEELGYLIKESQAEGALREGSGKILRDLLSFGDLSAAEVMVPRVKMVGIPLDASSDEIREIVRSSRHSRYPVFQGDLDHIRGMVHIKDLLKLVIEGGSLSRSILRSIPYVPETSRLEAVLAAMRRRRTHLAVVMDEFGGTAGLLVIEDLFAEVVGHIDHDAGGLQEAYRDGEGLLHVSGTIRLDEVGEHLARTLEHDEVFTVSGLVLALLDRRPRVGDSVVYDGIRFQVTTVKGHGVGECIVTPLTSDELR